MSVLALGAAVVDYIASVSRLPHRDEKIRSSNCQMVIGGNCLNAAVILSRLDTPVDLVSKLGKDQLGSFILQCCHSEGIGTKKLIMKPESVSSFSYILVEETTKSRTCIYNPCEDVLPTELNSGILDGVSVLLLDGKHIESASIVASWASARNIPIILDCETELLESEFLPGLISMATHLKCDQRFPVEYTNCEDLLEAMAIVLGQRKERTVVVTLGASGSLLMTQTTPADVNIPQVTSYTAFLEHMSYFLTDLAPKQYPRCFRMTFPSSLGPVLLIYCCPYLIPPEELVDTTGAGDAFLGSFAFSVLHRMPSNQMLPLASYLASRKCTGLGVQGLPYLHQVPQELLQFHTVAP